MVTAMSAIAIHRVVSDPDSAAAWYEAALGAEETSRLTLPNGRTVTVQLRLGDTALAVAGEYPQAGLRTPASLGGTPAALRLTVPDADAAFDRATKAGASVFEPVNDAFWGDRTGQVLDPSGHRWAFDQHVREVPAEEIARQAAQFFGPEAST